MNKQILVLNAGSSSIKYTLYKLSDASVVAAGLCERIGVDGNFKISYGDHKFEEAVDFSDHKKALTYLFNFLESKQLINSRKDIIGVGHRVVQGGVFFDDSVVVTPKELKVIEDLIPLAPLHNEPEVRIIKQIEELLPSAVNVACFDTSFHRTILPKNKTYALDLKLATKHQIQRYGFHGTSYKYITHKMRKILNKDSVNLIVLHLGNGASMSAIENNLSINNSMGFTPLEGLVMGTRSGDLDPAIIPFLCKAEKMSVSEVEDVLNKKSGLLGLSGSSDMRDLIAKVNKGNDLNANLALTIFAKRAADYLVKYANDLSGKIDAIVFTAGIGENAPVPRKKILEEVKLLNLNLDDKLNEGKIGDYQLISKPDSQYPVYVVRTNEELMIFEDVKRLLKL